MRRRAWALPVVALTLLTACGDDAGVEPERAYDVELHVDDSGDEYRYVAVDEIPEFRVGDEVTFVVDNTGRFPHDLQVQAPDGDVVGSADEVSPGETLEVTAYFAEAGIYRLNCLFDDHLTQHDMQTLIEVVDAPST